MSVVVLCVKAAEVTTFTHTDLVGGLAAGAAASAAAAAGAFT
jgi:hypothetical protein